MVLAAAAVADRNIDLHFVFYTKMILYTEEKACINVSLHVIRWYLVSTCMSSFPYHKVSKYSKRSLLIGGFFLFCFF